MKRRIQIGILCVLIGDMLLFSGCGNPHEDQIVIGVSQEAFSENLSYGDSENGLEEAEESASIYEHSEEETPSDGICYVHVCGAVVHPGVYLLSEEGRISDAVSAAGGVLPEAASDYLNLAQRVSDGDKIVVPFLSEVEDTPYGECLIKDCSDGESREQNTGNDAEGAAAGLVNINTADLETLMTLPEIGQSKAEAIVRYRMENGGFSCKEDLMQVSGIGEVTYGKLEHLISV